MCLCGTGSRKFTLLTPYLKVKMHEFKCGILRMI